MSLTGGIGDAIAVIKIAIQLYDSSIGVARDAKKEFGLFSRELKNLKSTLEGIKRECGPKGKLSSQHGSAEHGSTISDLEEAVEFTKDSLKCWNALLKDFGRRSQTIPWRLAWARKYQKITQCRDRIHIQSKLLEIVMLRIQTSQNCFIISEIQELKNAMPPMPTMLDTDKPPDTESLPEAESIRSSSSFKGDIYEKESTISDVTSIIQSIDEKISRIKRQKKRIRCGLQVPENTPSEEFTKKFQDSVDSEYDESLPEAWLSRGTWWLLKSMKLHELPGTEHLAQSYVDLLKASWILYNVLGMSKKSLETQDMIRSLSPQEWTLLENLGSAITYHTNTFKGVPIPDVATLDMANFSIWEPMTAEEFEPRNLFEPTLDPRRWITIEDEHAGIDDEKVLYRSFVQAQIGARAMRLLVEDTDYLICLVVPSEDTELTIILSNQAGTMNLSCSCSSVSWPPENPENDTIRGITIPFTKRSVPVTFKTSADYKKFSSLAHKYLKAVEDREPTEEENEIFRSILQGYHENNVNSGKPIQPYAPKHRPWYWELRIHETTTDKYWQTTRRLVISSCARVENPRCIDFFLPPSWVYVSENPQNPSEVTLKWSDCSQRDSAARTNGNFNKLYTYGCFPEYPNHSITFNFLNEGDAIEFSNTVLSLNRSVVSKVPLQSWSQNNPEYRLFRVRDLKRTPDSPEHYKALVITKSENSWTGKVSRDMEELWKHSEIYFFGRDIDFVTDDNNPSVIELIGVYYPLYLSTHIDQPRDAATLPRFSHAVVKKGKATVSLDATMMDGLRRQISPNNQWDIVEVPVTTTEVKEFMNALSDVWSFVLSMRVISIEYSQPSLFLAKPKKIPVYLQVWHNGISERLVARRIPASSGDPPEWISVQGATENSFSGAASHDTDSDRMKIRRCTIWRGKLLDTVKMQATNGKDTEAPLKVGEFVIRFQHIRQRDEFKDAFRRTTSVRHSSSTKS